MQEIKMSQILLELHMEWARFRRESRQFEIGALKLQCINQQSLHTIDWTQHITVRRSMKISSEMVNLIDAQISWWPSKNIQRLLWKTTPYMSESNFQWLNNLLLNNQEYRYHSYRKIMTESRLKKKINRYTDAGNMIMNFVQGIRYSV